MAVITSRIICHCLLTIVATPEDVDPLKLKGCPAHKGGLSQEVGVGKTKAKAHGCDRDEGAHAKRSLQWASTNPCTGAGS